MYVYVVSIYTDDYFYDACEPGDLLLDKVVFIKKEEAQKYIDNINLKGKCKACAEEVKIKDYENISCLYNTH